MPQLNPNQYKRLTKPLDYGVSDGLYWDITNSLLVLVIDDTVKAKIPLTQTTGQALVSDGTDIEPEAISIQGDELVFASEARGDILRRGASAWERVSAKDSGKILVGDGTDVASVAVSGDASLAANGALTVTDVTVGSDAAGDIQYKSSATALARLAKGTAGQVLAMNAGATAPQWTEVGGSLQAKPRLRCISETLTAASLTDGGAAIGTKNLTAAIPAGARFLYCTIDTITGFAEDTSAVITLGDGVDVDRYNTGTPSVFTTAAAGVDMGAPSGTAFHSAAIANVVATVTSAADITPVIAGAGSCILRFWFLEPI